MARTRLSQSQSERRNRAKEQWRQEKLQRSYRQGPPSTFDQLLGRDFYSLEKKRRRGVVTDRYRKQKTQLHHQRRAAERKLEEQLRRDKEDLRRRYRRLHRISRFDNSNPKWADVERDVQQKYREVKNRRVREFRDNWNARQHVLERQRDRDRRKVSEDMRRESREARGLPGQSQLPWQ